MLLSMSKRVDHSSNFSFRDLLGPTPVQNASEKKVKKIRGPCQARVLDSESNSLTLTLKW